MPASAKALEYILRLRERRGEPKSPVCKQLACHPKPDGRRMVGVVRFELTAPSS